MRRDNGKLNNERDEYSCIVNWGELCLGCSFLGDLCHLFSYLDFLTAVLEAFIDQARVEHVAESDCFDLDVLL